MKRLLVLTIVFCSLLISLQGQTSNAARNLQNLPNVISQNNGTLNLSIRNTLGNQSHFFGAETPNTATGHSYFSMNSLGTSNLSPAQVLQTIKSDPNSVFPYFQAQGVNGQALQLGSKFSLNLDIPNMPFSKNPVTVTADNPYYFTFTADKGHTLQGSATHGVFQDSSGELWLFQIGQGVPGTESEAQINLNNLIAEKMWEKMAENVKKLMNSQCENGVQNYVATLNGILKTGLILMEGQNVSLSASGNVTLGPLAGDSDPTGINYGVFYNLATQYKHGSLLVKISNENSLIWHYVGWGLNWKAPKSGELILAVNDTQNINNSGAYTVRIKISCLAPKK